jgi:hypothetical protein
MSETPWTTNYVTVETSCGPAAFACCGLCGAAVLMSRETPTAKALHEDWHKRQRATVRALAEGRHTIGAVGGAVVLPDEEK